MNIWVTSDTHFGHANIIRYCDRPFKDTDEMDQVMIDNWNSVVKPEDKIYHLGDVYMGSQQNAATVLSKLNGKKRLVLGNHDDGRDKLLQAVFKKISVWRIFRDYGLLLSHIPLHESNISGIGKKNNGMQHAKLTNVHGHIHQNKSPEGPYRCVCVEQTNYTPVNIDELRTT